MATPSKQTGPKDKKYVNKGEKYETTYEKKRKQPAEKFGRERTVNS